MKGDWQNIPPVFSTPIQGLTKTSVAKMHQVTALCGERFMIYVEHIAAWNDIFHDNRVVKCDVTVHNTPLGRNLQNDVPRGWNLQNKMFTKRGLLFKVKATFDLTDRRLPIQSEDSSEWTREFFVSLTQQKEINERNVFYQTVQFQTRQNKD